MLTGPPVALALSKLMVNSPFTGPSSSAAEVAAVMLAKADQATSLSERLRVAELAVVSTKAPVPLTLSIVNITDSIDSTSRSSVTTMSTKALVAVLGITTDPANNE